MVVALFTTIVLTGSHGRAGGPQPDLKRGGAFAFPQGKATVLLDRKDLRLSSWNNGTHLYVQAVLWEDNDADGIETDKLSGQQFKDGSNLLLDLNNDGKLTPKIDRYYTLDMNVRGPGLRYVIPLSDFEETEMKGDSKGRGAVRYVDGGAGKKLRVDSYLIPLEEVRKKPGDTIRVAYWARSARPRITLNSVGFESDRDYHSSRLPWGKFQELKLSPRTEALDVTQVPDEDRKKK
jgi:hypothetical protein